MTYDFNEDLTEAEQDQADEISVINNIAYRGYFYDSETGLYYLQSRYYDPETGRFINADDTAYIGYDDTPISANIFAYCGNNPVNYSDVYGYVAELISDKSDLNSKVNTAKRLCSKHKLIKVTYKTERRVQNGRFVNVTLPDIIPNQYYYSKDQTYIGIRYNRICDNLPIYYLLEFNILTVKQWNSYVVRKHKSLILSIKKQIVDYLDKRGWDMQKIEWFISDLGNCSNDKVAFAVNLYSIAIDVLSWLEKRRDNQDKYILNSIKGYKANQKIMIYMCKKVYERRVNQWVVVNSYKPY